MSSVTTRMDLRSSMIVQRVLSPQVRMTPLVILAATPDAWAEVVAEDDWIPVAIYDF